MGVEVWLGVAIVAAGLGYGAYLVGLRRHLVEPNRASWLIWSAATVVEASTYAAVNPHAAQRWVIVIAALASAFVTAAIWRRARWVALTRAELGCTAVCAAALLLWLAFHQAFWAHMLVVAAVPVSFWPTWASVWHDRVRERSPAWGLWTIGDLATVLVATRQPTGGVGGYAYLLMELTCHASVWLMVGLATVNPWRSLGVGRGGLWVLDAYSPTNNLFRVGETHLGKTVYAARGFVEGEMVTRFSGPRVARSKLPPRLIGRADRFVQVSTDQYMGPSGAIDDLINHSCEPNTGLRFGNDGVVLLAIRDIAPGEEIAWDYATTLTDRSWQMVCRCGTAECRGVIGAFDTLPVERQEWFRARNLVAPYLRRRDNVWKRERAA